MTSIPTNHSHGFALVVTLTLMVLLSILAIGLLSLSTISLRGTNVSIPAETARANARMAVMMALGELQRTAGDDRRITADGSIFSGATQPNAVGVWKSWSPKLALNPSGAAPDYTTPKTTTATDASAGGFLRWLVSSPTPADLEKADWINTGNLADPIDLFKLDPDGFQLSGAMIPLKDGTKRTGSYAWAISQAATKAKINVAGPEAGQRIANDDLQAQPRANLEHTDSFNQPSGFWNERAAKVVSVSQAELDASLWIEDESIGSGADFTTQGFGILSDVVNGGLKVDMSLGFEMSDSSFNADTWGAIQNPFRSDAAPDVSGGATYEGQRPLFKPLTDSASHPAQLTYFDPNNPRDQPAKVQFNFPVSGVPTFHSLRSYYRTHHYLYNTDDGLTLFERPADHTAITPLAPPTNYYQPPGATPLGNSSQNGFRPVVDRIMFLLSAGVDNNDNSRMIITPIITLWNPYNVALEIEGAVAYPWIDVPFGMKWTYQKPAVDGSPPPAEETRSRGMSWMGKQLNEFGHGRSVEPYFYAAITATGQPLSNSAPNPPIRFKPGEVRVFAPTSTTPKDFNKDGNIQSRTVLLRPVDSVSMLSPKGGLRVDMGSKKVATDETVEAEFYAVTGENYPFFISLEDARMAKLPLPSSHLNHHSAGTRARESNGGQAILDVITRLFVKDSSSVERFERRNLSLDKLRNSVPLGVLETYHRVADGPNANSDLVFTGNPRQPWMSDYVSNSGFKTGPQYLTRMRSVSSFNGVLETTGDGRSAFYGASQSLNSGRSNLSFFGIPQAPLLSRAAFQHADLSATPYSSANQFANSWASAYVARSKVAETPSGKPPMYDYSYLTNETIWDSFFFSGAAPSLGYSDGSGNPNTWNKPIEADVTLKLREIVEDFIRNPTDSPLRNPRMRLERGGLTDEELVKALTAPAGCVKIARHLMVDGAFNINSTSIEAWKSFLGGIRGPVFDVLNPAGQPPTGSETSFPRFRDPVGEKNDNWNGFRTLTDSQIETLATNIVTQVQTRGPFLSLGEFINRRVGSGELGLKGALQTAIDQSDLNSTALFNTLNDSEYPSNSRENVDPKKTGVGIPGYLTQADLLQSLAPVITVRSDTFTIRGYGEARDSDGTVAATAWCEAVVQRTSNFVDSSDEAHTAISNLKPANQTFGRRFKVVAIRFFDPT